MKSRPVVHGAARFAGTAVAGVVALRVLGRLPGLAEDLRSARVLLGIEISSVVQPKEVG